MNATDHKYFKVAGTIEDNKELIFVRDENHLRPRVVEKYVINDTSPYFKSLLRLHYGTEKYLDSIDGGMEYYKIIEKHDPNDGYRKLIIEHNLF